MYPELIFNLWGKSFSVVSYNLFFWLALLVVVFGSYLFAIKYYQLPKLKVFLILLFSAIFAIIGARLLNMFLNWNLYQNNPERLFSFGLQGFSLFGGVLGAVFSGVIFSLINKIDGWKLADAIAPFLGIGIATMRVGCFLNGCCYGKETKLPWGVTFPELSRSHLHQISSNPLSLIGGQSAVHPTQIYELIAALIGACLAFWAIKKKAPNGVPFLIFIIWFSTFRLFNNLLRVSPVTFDAPEFFYPAFYIIIVIICGIILAKKIKRSAREIVE